MSTEFAERTTYELADLEQRVFAWLIDGAILSIISGAGVATAHGVGFGAGLLIGFIYTWFFLTRNNGQTPGKVFMKIRVIKTDGTPIGDADAVLRHIGMIVNYVSVVGGLWAFIDHDRQGLHDKMAQTYVVKTT
ncbi:MAG: RDD family protein [Chloroflexi bacterium]|nr:RDD family protein [Chloroflexota bacterium]